MYEERNGKTQAQLIAENRDILSEAEDIIIIGFGFDQNNLIQLGFPYNEDEWNNFLAPRTRRKTIKWHNYNGQKVRISSILSKIKQTSPNIDLIEATTTDISTAYINSFK